MSLATVASIVGIGAGAKSLFGGSQQGGSSSSNTYVPTGLGGADQIFQQLLGQGSQASSAGASQLNPQLLQALTQYLGINTSGLTGSANYAGDIYGNLVPAAQSAQSTLAANAGGATAAGQALWNTAQDPQNKLRDQMQQQVTDASRAGTSARGIGMGGEAAGIENKDVSDFLINWQNQQLARQATGLQGLNASYDQAGRDISGSLAAGSLAPQFAQQAGQVPYQGQVQAASQPFNAASAYTGAQSGVNQQLSGWLQSIIPYLNSGQGATGQAFGQQQTGLNNFTTGLQQFGMNAPGAWNALSNIFQQQTPGSGSSNAYDSGYGGYVPYGGGP